MALKDIVRGKRERAHPTLSVGGWKTHVIEKAHCIAVSDRTELIARARVVCATPCVINRPRHGQAGTYPGQIRELLSVRGSERRLDSNRHEGVSKFPVVSHSRDVSTVASR